MNLIKNTLIVFPFFIYISFLLAKWIPFFDSVNHFLLFHLFFIILSQFFLLIIYGLKNNIKYCLLAIIFLIFIHLSYLMEPVVIEKSTPFQEFTFMQFNLFFKNQNKLKVKDYINKHIKPDFIALQEVSKNNQILLNSLKFEYPYQYLCPFRGVGHVAILSKTPKRKDKNTICVKGKGFISVPIDIPNDDQGVTTIWVSSYHGHWPYPHGQKKQINELAPTFSKLKKYSDPIIIGGDFNAAPWSQSVATIENYTNTKIIKGLRNSWHPSFKKGLIKLIFLPIDHILIKQLKIVKVKTGGFIGSDHRPIVTTFIINKNE